MKQVIILATLFSSIVFTSCRKHTLRGEGSVITVTRDLASFEEVAADGDLDIVIYPSNINQAVITGYENLVPVFETDIRNGKLRLKYPDKYFNIRHNNIKVEVYTTSMRSFSINGSGKADIQAGFPLRDMDLEINGSGDINVANNQFITMHGKISGSGNINARNCTVDNAFLRISGSGNIDLAVLKKLDVHISGSGDVNYWGSPETVETDISGSGKVRKKG